MIFGIQQRIQALIGEYFRGVLEEEEGGRANNRDMDVTPRETENILFHFHFPIGYISLPILDSPTLHEQPENTPIVQTSAISLNRLIVDLVAAAAGVLPFIFPNTSAMLSFGLV